MKFILDLSVEVNADSLDGAYVAANMLTSSICDIGYVNSAFLLDVEVDEDSRELEDEDEGESEYDAGYTNIGDNGSDD